MPLFRPFFAKFKSSIMYKLTILFFLLTTYCSQSLTDNYKITFDNENASYTVKIDNGSLIFENNQPDVTVTTPFGSTQELPNSSGKIYKITKGGTWQEGLKIGANDETEMPKIGGNGDTDISKIDETNNIFSIEDHHTYDIKLSFKFVTVVEKSGNIKQQFEIPTTGLFVYIKGNKFGLLK